MNDTRQRCLDAGMDDYLSKPVDAQELVRAVQRFTDPRPVVIAVDDSHEMRLLLQRYLEQDGRCRVITAPSAFSALTHLKRREPHLLLLDIEMPVMGGLELASEIRASYQTPLVALTGHRDAAFTERAMAAGFNAVLNKPISREQLLSCVDAVLRVPTPVPVTRVVADSVLGDLVPSYLEARQNEIPLLLQSLAAQDFGSLKRRGHNLKGSGPSYGFAALGVAGSKLEFAAASSDIDGCTTAIHQITEVLSQLNATGSSEPLASR